MPPPTDTISDILIAKFFSKLQVHLSNSAEVIVGDQEKMYLLNSKMGDVTYYHTAIWYAMGDITKKLISHGVFLDNLNIDALMKEAREAHILTANKKTSVENAMAQATSAAYSVVSVSTTLTQLVTPGA